MIEKSRFCPSPTGRMHLGNIRTALFSWLYARSQQGVFLLRIEDTDAERSSDQYADLILDDMHSLNLDWDEGPQLNDEKSTQMYRQSRRGAIYQGYYQRLIEKDAVYPCFCSAESLAITRKRQLASGQPPRYPGTCSRLSKEEIAARREKALPEVLRFRINDDAVVSFTDAVRGQQTFRGVDMGDLIISKHDGTPTFMFCNAIDDALMGVTLVMRGEDHLTNTPRQILILRALDLPVPNYAHLSIVLGNDGTPLSKRNGSASLDELINIGYHPLAICNYIARLGHVYQDNSLLSMDQLAQQFSLERLVKSASSYDVQQLDYWQKRLIETLDCKLLGQWLKAELGDYQKRFIIEDLVTFVRSNIIYLRDVRQWLPMLDDDLIIADEASQIISEAGKNFFQLAEQASSNYASWQSIVELLKDTGVKGKKLFMPLRAALTGRTTGPSLPDLVKLIGMTQVRKRFANAAQLADKSS